MTYNDAYYEDFEKNTIKLPYEKLDRMFDMVKYNFGSNDISVLDAGCGTGLMCKYLSEKGIKNITGADKFEHPLLRAKELVPECNFIRCDLNEKLDFPGELFDLIVSNEVIEHLEYPGIFIAESYRLLKTGGSLIIKTPNGFDFARLICKVTDRTWYADKDKTHIRYFNVFSIRKLLASCGFGRTSVRTGTKPLMSIKGVKIPPIPYLGNGVVSRGIK